MCEPHHSIVQIPSMETKGQYLGSLGKWCTKIKDYFHLSKMGKGHSESLWAINKAIDHKIYLGHGSNNYEVAWWERVVRPDLSKVTAEELVLAKTYANQTSIGNLTTLRRFIESSLRCSQTPLRYIINFKSKFLNKKGRRLFESKLRGQLGIKRLEDITIDDSSIRAILGFTRKRELLVPEWGQDNKLWTPGR